MFKTSSFELNNVLLSIILYLSLLLVSYYTKINTFKFIYFVHFTHLFLLLLVVKVINVIYTLSWGSIQLLGLIYKYSCDYLYHDYFQHIAFLL